MENFLKCYFSLTALIRRQIFYFSVLLYINSINKKTDILLLCILLYINNIN